MNCFKNFEFTEKKLYNGIVIFYVVIGLMYLFIDRNIPPNYAVLSAFLLFKMVANYKKCTISYLECKIRGVKRQEGILASILDHVVDLRDSDIKYLLYFLGAVILLTFANQKIKNLNPEQKLEIKEKFLNFFNKV
jgi:hypothetical protein